MRIESKVAIITGGGSGIGRATALFFAKEGASVVVAGRREDPLVETADEMQREAGGDAYYVVGDVTKGEDATRIVEETVSRFGRVDILFNNAGEIRRDLPLDKTEEDVWDSVIRSNLKGVYLVSRAAIPAMLKNGGGSIVNNASSLALVAIPGSAAYSAAKGAVVSLSRSMALDYAPKIRVNAVSPGLVHTPLSYVDRPNFDELKGDLAADFPMGRIGSPEDVASAVLFLASDEASWITGTNLVVDGGAMIR
ncbi:MAG: glucose 1-dehydrogenase [Planctomycetota bacterium]|nr:glucose 1-dehydrogenase [Planctomycetota bacterium]